MRRVRGREIGAIGEEAEGAAGVQEEHRLVGSEAPALQLLDHPVKGLAGVDRVEEQSLGAAGQSSGLERRGVGHGVGGSLVTLEDSDLLFAQERYGHAGQEAGTKLFGDLEGARTEVDA